MIDHKVKDYKVINSLKEEFLIKIRLLFIFRSNEVLFTTSDDDFFTYGRNEYGCLGTGNMDPLGEPTKIDELCGFKIIDIVAGRYHMMALTEDGKVFTWGQNNCAQLGHDEMNQDFHKPSIVKALKDEKITKICCGHSHSLALNDRGEIFSWGSNEWGEVGSGKEDTSQAVPIRLKGLGRDKVSAIACGLYHSLALTELGKVYT
jgi:alpha-tubulin suppressor-like RCC1 family protein